MLENKQVRRARFKPDSHIPPTYRRFSQRRRPPDHLRRCTDVLFSGSPAHLRGVAGVPKLTRNANRIGAIHKSYMDRIVLLECQFSRALVLEMRYVRRKEKLEKMKLGESTGCGHCFKGILACDTFHRHFESWEL